MQRATGLLLRHGSAAEAAPLVKAGLRQPGRFPGIEDAALRLARKYHREGDPERARMLYRHLHERFPSTAAGRQAERALSGLSS
jgi:TolA-binding protein